MTKSHTIWKVNEDFQWTGSFGRRIEGKNKNREFEKAEKWIRAGFHRPQKAQTSFSFVGMKSSLPGHNFWFVLWLLRNLNLKSGFELGGLIWFSFAFEMIFFWEILTLLLEKNMKPTNKVFSTFYHSICGWIYILLKRSPIFVYIRLILFTKQMGYFLKTSFLTIVDMHPFQRTYYKMAEETFPVNSSINLIMGKKRPPIAL